MGIVMSQPKRSSRIDQGAVCGPQAHDDLHRSATGRAAGDERCRVFETRRRLEIAAVKTYGARYVRAEWACGVAWLWTFQGIVQPCGSMDSSSPALVISSFHMAR